MDAETGSTATASATTHSGSNGDFPEPSDLPRIGGVAQRDFVSAPASLNLQGRFGLFVSAPKIPFPRNGEIGAEPQRAETIAFTPAYAEIEATYLVPSGSALKTIADIDSAGVRRQ